MESRKPLISLILDFPYSMLSDKQRSEWLYAARATPTPTPWAFEGGRYSTNFIQPD